MATRGRYLVSFLRSVLSTRSSRKMTGSLYARNVSAATAAATDTILASISLSFPVISHIPPM